MSHDVEISITGKGGGSLTVALDFLPREGDFVQVEIDGTMRFGQVFEVLHRIMDGDSLPTKVFAHPSAGDPSKRVQE